MFFSRLSLLALIGLTGAWTCMANQVIWTYDGQGGYVDCSPAVGDLDGDGKIDIVVATTAGNVVAIDGLGHVMWEHTIRGPITIPPTLAALGNAGGAVLALNNAGQLHCLQAQTGRPMWSADLPGSVQWGATAIAVADLDQDRNPEIIAGDSTGNVACLNGNGEIKWMFRGDHGWTLCPAIADLDGDGAAEILIAGTDVPLICLSHDGKERWRITDKTNGASPVVANISGDPNPEILCGIDKALAAVDANGALLWRVPMARPIDSAIAVAYLNEDDAPEILAVDLSGLLVCVDPTGRELWRADVEERARRSPSVGDVDGDGRVEILVAGYSGAVHVFDAGGALKERIALGSASNASATLCDLTGDGRLSMVCPTVAGTMKVFQWPSAKTETKALWPEYRLSSQRTAALIPEVGQSSVQLTRIEFGDLYVGSNRLELEIANPLEESLEILVTITQNNEPPVSTTAASQEPRITVETPYVIAGDRSSNIRLEAVVRRNGSVLLKRSKQAYIVPFQKELADADALLNQTDAALQALAHAQDMQARAAFVRAQLAQYRERAAAIGTAAELERRDLRDALRRHVADARDLHALVTTAATVLEKTQSTVAITSANPWAPFGGMRETHEGRLVDSTTAVSAFAGEVESAALNIFNFSGASKVFRVTAGAFEGPSGPVPGDTLLEFREAVDVPTDLLDVTPDALPTLNQGALLTVPPWGARQLWLTIRTKGLAAGEWKGDVTLKTLDVEPSTVSAPITLTVWPHALPDEQALRLCHWGYVHSSVLKDQPAAALADQVDHGTNVFVGLFYPEATYDEQGNLGAIDFTAHDDYVKEHAPHGIILFFNYQHALKGPGGQQSDAYAKAHVQWLRAWVAHLKELGVGYDGFALYPVDEPGLSDGLVDTHIRMAKLAREADPQIRLYTDPVGRITMPELEALAPYVDIWCPNRNGFLLKTNADMLDFIKSTGSEMWTYECEGNAKHQSPLGYYRGLAWLAWHHGLTGIGFWSYCTSQFDPWFSPEKSFDYLLIYQGDGVVTSKRWEAVRDGIEDYAMLRALQQAADAAEQAGRNSEAVQAARALLNDRASAIAQFCGLDEAGTLPGRGGAPAARKTADTRWAAIMKTRNELAAVLELLSADGADGAGEE